MKKSLVALAAMTVVASAFADVDVSGGIKMYGVIDQSVMSQKLVSADDGAENNYLGMFAANATSRLGFKGARDLSEGLKGIFQVELEIAPDTATLLPSANRTAFVGLQGNMGSIMFGTMETAAYEVFGMDVNGRVEYKPQVWRTTTSLSLQDRANNSIKYISPEFNGFNLHVQRSFNEQADTATITATTSNTYAEFSSWAVKYHKDQFKAAYVHDETKNALMGYRFAGLANAGVTGSTNGLLYYGMDKTGTTAASYAADVLSSIAAPIQRDIGAVSYDFGNFSVNYLYAKSYQTGDYAGSNTTNTLGAKVPYEKFTFALSVGTGVVKSYTSSATISSTSTTAPTGRAKDGIISDTTLGIYYNFDKSTSVYFLGSNSSSSVGVKDGSNQTVAMGARYNF